MMDDATEDRNIEIKQGIGTSHLTEKYADLTNSSDQDIGTLTSVNNNIATSDIIDISSSLNSKMTKHMIFAVLLKSALK